MREGTLQICMRILQCMLSIISLGSMRLVQQERKRNSNTRTIVIHLGHPGTSFVPNTTWEVARSRIHTPTRHSWDQPNFHRSMETFIFFDEANSNLVTLYHSSCLSSDVTSQLAPWPRRPFQILPHIGSVDRRWTPISLCR
jgi:hypothetical protein